MSPLVCTDPQVAGAVDGYRRQLCDHILGVANRAGPAHVELDAREEESLTHEALRMAMGNAFMDALAVQRVSTRPAIGACIATEPAIGTCVATEPAIGTRRSPALRAIAPYLHHTPQLWCQTRADRAQGCAPTGALGRCRWHPGSALHHPATYNCRPMMIRCTSEVPS